MKKFRRTKKGVQAQARPLPKPKTKKVWAIAVVLVMAFSIIGFLTIDLGDVEKYNGHTLTAYPDNSWRLSSHEQIPFRFHPADLESVPFTKKALRPLKSSAVIFMTSPPDDRSKEVIGETLYDLLYEYRTRNVQVLQGFSKENKYDKPVITCANASTAIPVIVFESTEQPSANLSIVEKDGCVTISAPVQQDFSQVKERIIYGLYEVMEDDAYADYIERSLISESRKNS